MSKLQANEEKCAVSDCYFNEIPRINNLPFDSEEESEITNNSIKCTNRAMIEALREERREKKIARKEKIASSIVFMFVAIVISIFGASLFLGFSKHFGPLSNRELGVWFILLVVGITFAIGGLWGYVDNVIKGNHKS